MNGSWEPRPEQPSSGEDQGMLNGEHSEAESTGKGRGLGDGARMDARGATEYPHGSRGVEGQHMAAHQPYPGPWQAQVPGAYGYPAGGSGYVQKAPKKRVHWPFVVAASILALASIVSGVWILIQPKSYDAIAEQCENSLTMRTLGTFTGLTDMAEELGLADDEGWDEVPEVITVASDSKSMTVHDRYAMSIDAVEYLSGTTGRDRERRQDFVDQWNGIRDLAIMGAVGCVHDELGIPDSVERRMLSTRALDGTQELVHSGTRIMWSYHPSRGMDVLYEKE